MKVKIEFTLEVNAKAWANEYGIENEDVRSDVKDYFEASNLIPEHLEDIVKPR